MLNFKNAVAGVVANTLKNVKGGYCGRERFHLTYGIYHFLPLLGYDYQRQVEWRFVMQYFPRKRAQTILDVGSTSSLFIYELAARGKTTGIDFRKYAERLPASIAFVTGDASATSFPDASFDCIVMISVIEHIGYGAYADPLYADGDFKAMKEMKRLLKPGGTLFLTTNIGAREHFSHSTSERVYDKNRLQGLFEGLSIKKESYFFFDKRWRQATKEFVFEASKVKFGVACVALTK